MNEYNKLLNDFLNWQDNYQKEIDRLGYGYNIFTLMNIESDEVYLHSSFIADLLNPNGTHSMGNKFLKKFIEMHHLNFSCDDVKVVKEQYIGRIDNEEASGGRIDIFITNKLGEKIIIENKIHAPDQTLQLVRYFNKYKDARIIYLTLFGEEPLNKSIKHNDTLVEDLEYICISYHRDIIEWIEFVIKDDKSINSMFSATCRQYINTLKKLTHQPLLEDMNKELEEIVKKNLEAFNEIQSVIPIVKAKIQKEFWDKLEEAIERKLIKDNISFSSMSDLREKKNATIILDYYNPNKRSAKDFGLHFNFFQGEGDYRLVMSCLLHHNLYYAFQIIKNDGNKIEDEIFKYFQKDICTELLYEGSDKGKYWNYTNPKLNFRKFDTSEVLNLVNSETLDNTIEQIAEQMITEAYKIKNVIEKMNIR